MKKSLVLGILLVCSLKAYSLTNMDKSQTTEEFESLFHEYEKTLIRERIENINFDKLPISPSPAEHSCPNALSVHAKYTKILAETHSTGFQKLNYTLLKSLAKWKQANSNAVLTDSILKDLLKGYSTYTTELVDEQMEFLKKIMTLELNWVIESYEYCIAHAQTSSEKTEAIEKLNNWSVERAKVEALVNIELLLMRLKKPI